MDLPASTTITMITTMKTTTTILLPQATHMEVAMDTVLPQVTHMEVAMDTEVVDMVGTATVEATLLSAVSGVKSAATVLVLPPRAREKERAEKVAKEERVERA